VTASDVFNKPGTGSPGCTENSLKQVWQRYSPLNATELC